MTIKWVQQDPLVMNGEPFCYGSRLTVRQLLELRSNGYDLTMILKDHPELRVLGIAAAYVYAADHKERYAEFFERNGSLAGPGLQRGGGGQAARPVPGPGHRRQGGEAGRLIRLGPGSRGPRRAFERLDGTLNGHTGEHP